MIGERWTLLIVRELLAGARRYSDLHADLPGISTDVLAARLKEMEQDCLVTRRRLAPPAAATVYELTPRGRGLLAALTALADWGTADLADPRPTDALRAHWSALPLMRMLADLAVPHEGTVNIRLGEDGFHIAITAAGPSYGHGLVEHPHAQLVLGRQACDAVTRGDATLPALIGQHLISVEGDSPLAKALRAQSGR